MAVGVGHALLGSQSCPALSFGCVGALARFDILGIRGVARDKALFGDVKNSALDTVADNVVEEGNSCVELLCVLLNALIILLACAGGCRIS